MKKLMMAFFRFWVILAALGFTLRAVGTESLIVSGEDQGSSVKSWQISMGLNDYSAEIELQNHRRNRRPILGQMVSIGMGKELYSQYLFSMSMKVFGGTLVYGEKKHFSNLGSIFGGHVSLNLNYHWFWNVRVQPFVLYGQSLVSGEYRESSGRNKTNLHFQERSLDSGIGFRVIDESKRLYSYFQLVRMESLSGTLQSAFIVNEKERQIAASVRYSPEVYAFGFGYLF